MIAVCFAREHPCETRANAADPVKAVKIGDKVPDSNSLRDLRGGPRSLHGFTGYNAIVLVFLSADCPVSNLYVPTLIDLQKRYLDKKVHFVAVYPNEPEDLDQIAMHMSDRDIPFLAVKDFGQRLADSVGITRVPSVAVLDGSFALKYRGRIDDRYGAGTRRQKASRDDLVTAIDEVLTGKKLAIAETDTDGCLLGRDGKPAEKTNVSYAKDVAPILQKRCETCHRDGQNAPFSLSSFDDAFNHAAMLKEVTTQRRMPPWHADPRYGHFANDRRLTKDEIATLG
jgi:thiol-disulfide isomerase/thioredoxin